MLKFSILSLNFPCHDVIGSAAYLQHDSSCYQTAKKTLDTFSGIPSLAASTITLLLPLTLSRFNIRRFI